MWWSLYSCRCLEAVWTQSRATPPKSLSMSLCENIQPGERQMAVLSNKAFPAKSGNYYCSQKGCSQIRVGCRKALWASESSEVLEWFLSWCNGEKKVQWNPRRILSTCKKRMVIGLPEGTGDLAQILQVQACVSKLPRRANTPFRVFCQTWSFREGPCVSAGSVIYSFTF